MQVWKIPVEEEAGEGRSAVQVTRHGGFAAFESPDGKYVYYAKSRDPENAIWRVSAEGGEEAPVIKLFSSGWGHWAVVETGIYFVDRPATPSSDGRWIVNFFSFDQERSAEIATLSDPPHPRGPGLSVSPDGRWILCTQVDESSSDLMLVKNFH